MNTKALSRIFKEEVGENFVDYLARLRMDEAKRLPKLRKLQLSACLPLHSGLMHPVLGRRAQEHFFELSGIIIMITEPAVHGHL